MFFEKKNLVRLPCATTTHTPAMSQVFYLMDERHTLASALRCALEERCETDDIVSCTLLHPLDNFIVVRVPEAQLLRTSLLSLKEAVQRARLEVQAQTQ